MNVVIVHYHLRRGGVTRVIENACEALAGHGIRPLVLSGEPYSGRHLRDVAVIPGLCYRDADSAPDPRTLAAEMVETARRHLGAHPDLWHIHNHSLGKNPAITGALSLLLRDGARALLQIHDFAEDGRPANYRRILDFHHDDPERLRHGLYPNGPGVHYAVLNDRDQRVLSEAGCPSEFLHLLPNAVSAPPDGQSPGPVPELFPGKQVFVYPTRGIRRKNIGELLLLATTHPEERVLLSTLRPENPEWQEVHGHWEQLARDLRLPVILGAVDAGTATFPRLMARADALLSTSIAEGFGLAFLEPWLIDKPLAGRSLPEITSDFLQAGLNLDNLYPSLPVPIELVGRDTLLQRYEDAIARSYSAFARTAPADAAERALAACSDARGVDFGALPEDLQERVIRHAVDHPGAVLDSDPLSDLPGASRIRENRQVAESMYSLDRYAERLVSIYDSIMGGELGSHQFLDPLKVLSGFLKPERFHLLRA